MRQSLSFEELLVLTRVGPASVGITPATTLLQSPGRSHSGNVANHGAKSVGFPPYLKQIKQIKLLETRYDVTVLQTDSVGTLMLIHRDQQPVLYHCQKLLHN